MGQLHFDLHIVMADPAGNRTAIVTEASKLPGELYASLGAEILADSSLRAEQVGFSVRGKHGFPRLEMCGGEFCGNAARSFGCYLALQDGKAAAGGEITIEISGRSAPMQIRLTEDGAVAEMALPKKIGEIRKEEILDAFRQRQTQNPPHSQKGFDAEELLSVTGIPERLPVIHLEGISHVILREFPAFHQESAKKYQPLLDSLIDVVRKDNSIPAVGVISLSENRLCPYVYVRGPESRVFESSCASGSIAAAWLLSQSYTSPLVSFRFLEPGGILTAEIRKYSPEESLAYIGGPVHIEAAVRRSYTIHDNPEDKC